MKSEQNATYGSHSRHGESALPSQDNTEKKKRKKKRKISTPLAAIIKLLIYISSKGKLSQEMTNNVECDRDLLKCISWSATVYHQRYEAQHK
jgi:hypothetical protein